MADTPRLKVLCVYPDGSSPPDEVSFRLSPRYGIHNALEAHQWFLKMMQSDEEFEVETARAEQAQEVLTLPAAPAVSLNRGN